MTMLSFKQIRVAALSAISVVLLAAPIVTQADDASIERSKIDAAAITRGMQGAFSLDKNGNVATNEGGLVMRGPGSAFASEEAGALAQSITGTTGYQGLANPASRGAAAGAQAQLEGKAEFSCNLQPGHSLSAAGVSFKFQGCSQRNGHIESVALQVCAKATNGGLCRSGDYSERRTFTVGAWHDVEGVAVGVNCDNTTKRCLLSVTSKFAVVGNAQQIADQAQDRQGGRELRQQLRSTVESQEYANQISDQLAFRECYAENETSFGSEGKVRTCDGQKEITVAGGPANAKCEPTRTCTKQETVHQSYRTTCTRTFGLTSYQCTATPKTRVCTGTFDAMNGNQKSSCSDEELEGAVEVSRSEIGCEAWMDVWEATPVCIRRTYSIKYMYPEDVEYTDCEAKPSGLAGPFNPQTCAMGSAERELISCAIDGWYNRTLSDSECTATEVDSDGNTITFPLDESRKAGCGFCTKSATVSFTCKSNEAPQFSCTDKELEGCALTNVVPENSAYGITLSETWHYSCNKTRTSCTEWKVDNTSCPNIDGSYGVDQMTFMEADGSAAFAEAMATAGVAEALAQAKPGGTAADPRLFEGKAMTCEYPVGFGSDWVANNCCKIGLTKAGGSKVSNKCTDDEVKLASARRNKYVVPLGEYCSSKSFWGSCRKRRQVYCVFEGMLPRIVQEQGRAQLNQAGRSLGTTETRPFQFDYYAGDGQWSHGVSANGVEVRAFQQPSYCASSKLAAQRLAQDPTALECPATLDVWFAACVKAGGCGPLPAFPENGSEHWQLTTVNPLQVMQTAVANRAIVTGACDTETGKCNYELSVWPKGSAGRATVTREFAFDIFTAGETEAVLIGDVLVRAQPKVTRDGSGKLPAGISASVSGNNGTSWSAFTLPTRITGAFQIPGTSVSVSGGCSELTGLCQYQLTGTVEIEALPWGNAKNPNCEGFTLAQFSALDLSEMDLTEWTATLQDEAPSESEIAAQVAQNVANAPAQAADGNSSVTINPSRAVVFVKPINGLGPFDVQLSVPSHLPTNVSDPIHAVEVDWGDCTGRVNASSNAAGNGYVAQHRYAHPADVKTSGFCQNKPVATPTGALKHTVIVTIHARSGTYTEKVEVTNRQ